MAHRLAYVPEAGRMQLPFMLSLYNSTSYVQLQARSSIRLHFDRQSNRSFTRKVIPFTDIAFGLSKLHQRDSQRYDATFLCCCRTGCTRRWISSGFTSSTAKPKIVLSDRRSGRARTHLYLMGLAILCVSIYAGLVISSVLQHGNDSEVTNHKETREKFDELASIYDAQIGMDESVMGLGWFRWWLTRKITGHALEVAVGTGRNFVYYDLSKIKSLTFVDQSDKMIERAKAKWSENYPNLPPETNPVNFCSGKLEELQLPRAQFDVVYETFGLCSTPEPIKLLQCMQQLVADDGKIILMEHGRSSWSFINAILDKHAVQHIEKWGCCWNRDILKLVEESGMIIDSCSRWHFGTTYVIYARKRSST